MKGALILIAVIVVAGAVGAIALKQAVDGITPWEESNEEVYQW